MIPRLPQIVLLWLTCGWLGIVSLASAADAPTAKDAQQPAGEGSQAGPGETLVVEQEQVADRFKKLEDALLRMAELTQQEDPRRAELLRKVVAHSKESHIASQLDEIARLLEKEQLFQAGKDQTEAHQNLTKLLELLLSEDRTKRIESEKERIRNYLSRVNRIIKDQKDLQGQTPDALNPQGLATRQGGLADKTGELGKDMQKAAGEKLADGKNADGAQGDGDDSKSGDSKSAKDKKDGSKDTDKKDTDKQDRDKKDSDKKRDGQKDKKSDGKDGEQGSGKDSQGQDSKDAGAQGSQGGDQSEQQDSQGQQGKSQQGKSQQGKSQQGGQQQDGEQQDAEQEPQDSQQDQSSPGENSARKRIQAAQERMQQAKKKLEEAKKHDAVDKQEEAVRQLEQAKAELEQILRQLREEEVERTLAMLEARFRKMLEMQTEVYNGTKLVDATPEADRDRDAEIESGRLSRKESLIVVEADKALTLMREEGSAVAFPEAVTQMRDDMEQIVARLATSNTGKITQGIEEDVIKALEEMIASLKQAQKDAQQRKGQPMPMDGEQQDEPLVDKIAELKMIKALQLRVNTRHERYSKLVDGEQADDPELVDALQRLKERQERIHSTTRDIVVGRNK